MELLLPLNQRTGLLLGINPDGETTDDQDAVKHQRCPEGYRSSLYVAVGDDGKPFCHRDSRCIHRPVVGLFIEETEVAADVPGGCLKHQG